jgi:serine/threonine-protein kinase
MKSPFTTTFRSLNQAQALPQPLHNRLFQPQALPSKKLDFKKPRFGVKLNENQRLIADRYQLGELIGRGGMADVYEGVDTRLGRVVAIKLLKLDLANDPTFESRFRQEAQSSARMAHPTIVRVYDTGEDVNTDNFGNEQRRPFIVMEFVRGAVLRDLMHQRRLTIEESIEYAEGVLTALEISHRAGIVHRDIKSANIMVTDAGQVKVMDFGIARVVSSNTATQAHTSGIVGTAQYFSPEQARGEIVDFRSDLYSTGVLLYEMLAGQPPFKGETAVSVAYQHVSEAVIAPSEHNVLISAELDHVVLRALAKNKDDRFQSAEEFREHLLAAVGVALDVKQSVAEVPLQIIEPDPLSDFDALLRGEATPNIPAPKAVETSATVTSLGDIPLVPVTEAAAKEAADVDAVASKLEELAVLDEPPVIKIPPMNTRLKDSATLLSKTSDLSKNSEVAATTVIENPFSDLGVQFSTEAAHGEVTKRGREKSLAAPSAKAIWTITTALLVVIVGLGAWFTFNGGMNLNFAPPSLGVKVADVVGKTYDEGFTTLTAQKLAVHEVFTSSDTIEVGTIISTDPPAGTLMGTKTVVEVTVSSGRSQVKLPKLEGLKDSDAIKALEAAGLSVGTVTMSTSATVKAGHVISSDPAAGTLLASQTAVNLTVSNGKINVPDVRGLTTDAAQKKVSAPEVGMSFKIDTAQPCSGTLGFTVIDQSPLPGLNPQGTPITLFVECQ